MFSDDHILILMFVEKYMAMKDPKLTAGSNGAAGKERLPYPKEAYEYDDDVTVEAVEQIRRKVGIDFSAPEWVTVDGFGQVIHA